MPYPRHRTIAPPKHRRHSFSQLKSTGLAEACYAERMPTITDRMHSLVDGMRIIEMTDTEAFCQAQAQLRGEVRPAREGLGDAVAEYWREQALRVRDRVILVGLLRNYPQWGWGHGVNAEQMFSVLRPAEQSALALPSNRNAAAKALDSWAYRFSERVVERKPTLPLVRPWDWPEMPSAYRLDWCEAIWLGHELGHMPCWDRSPLPAPDPAIAPALDGVGAVGL